MKYSIWVIPPEPDYSNIKKVIDGLSKKYKSPLFEPHMTVVGDIDKDLSEIERNLGFLLSNSKRLELSLGPVSFSTTYFQSIIVRVNSTAKLMKLNMDIKEMLGLENKVFMPHISLLYGNHNMFIREKIASSVEFPALSFTVNEFIITPSTDKPSEWIHSKVVPFG